jgi:Mg-chelatase subunit ChlD
LVLYKDYFDDFLTQIVPFTSDLNTFQRSLNGIKPGGGRDVPEAVYEALYEAATAFQWETPDRLVILIGDAPPHPEPRGKITKAMMDGAVDERNIKVTAIILPQ